jgi:hypothetical protein
MVMGPTNSHERSIAHIVDNLDAAGRLPPTAIEDVIAVLNFTMSKSDREFLVKYVRWRMDHPIVK